MRSELTPQPPPDLWYWLDTGWGCGAILVRNGVVVDGAPIFIRLWGQRLEKMKRLYQVALLQ